MLKYGLLPLLLTASLATAQQTGDRLLSGTTFGLPWGLYEGGLTNLQDGENRLRLSAPEGARVLGTRYDEGSKTALLTYRTPLPLQEVLNLTVAQLERQGFDPTSRVFPTEDPGGQRGRALLKRTDRLVELQFIRGAQDVTQVLVQFRELNRPERLLTSQAPANWFVYAAPINLNAAQVQPGNVYLTPPGDVLIDVTSYRSGEASLLFYGGYSLEQLADFYLPFFQSQGFSTGPSVDSGELSRTYKLTRAGETYSLILNASRSTQRARVTLAQAQAQ